MSGFLKELPDRIWVWADYMPTVHDGVWIDRPAEGGTEYRKVPDNDDDNFDDDDDFLE